MYKLSPILRKSGACTPAMRWLAKNQYATFEEMIKNCQRPDWLLWLAYAVRVDPYLIFEVCCAMARRSFDVLESQDAITALLLLNQTEKFPMKSFNNHYRAHSPYWNLPFWVRDTLGELYVTNDNPFFILMENPNFFKCRATSRNLKFRTDLSDIFRSKVNLKMLEKKVLSL